jgi:hypothetical protein
MPGGQAFYRANWEEMDFVGRAPFIVKRRD